ncbi:MAG: TfoX/Sxy family protein [Rhodospirillaceae bacterium]|nr:TfoX/Sxy family protein [Rhodospirillaceae bacterium]
MPQSLTKLKNIGPATLRQLEEVGVDTPDKLRQLGTVDVYGRLKHAFPGRVNMVMAYALEGAIRNCHWNHLPAAVREQLRDDCKPRWAKSKPVPQRKP